MAKTAGDNLIYRSPFTCCSLINILSIQSPSLNPTLRRRGLSGGQRIMLTKLRERAQAESPFWGIRDSAHGTYRSPSISIWIGRKGEKRWGKGKPQAQVRILCSNVRMTPPIVEWRILSRLVIRS